MAAVTTDIPLRWHSAEPTRLRVIGVPPSPEVMAHAARPRRVAPGAYRLRRLAAVAVVIGLVLAAWLALEVLAGLLGVSGSSAAAPASTASPTVVVAPGDTFWGIASRLQPHGDPRPLVGRLVAAHGPGRLQAGEHLSVPRN